MTSPKDESSAAKRAADELAPKTQAAEPKKKARKTKAVKDAANDVLDRLRAEFRKPVQEENLSEEAKADLTRAREVFVAIEKPMMALVRAASERWRPKQSLTATSETSPPVIGDEEYDDILFVIESMSEARLLQKIGDFLGLPVPMVDDIAKEKLRGKLLPARLASRPSGLPISIQKSTREPEDL